MTVRERFEAELCGCGLQPKQARRVMDIAIPKLNAGKTHESIWERPASEYPDVFYRFRFLEIKPIALEWIDKNCPGAWFRPVFEGGGLITNPMTRGADKSE